MKRTISATLVLAAALAGLAPGLAAKDKQSVDIGKREYNVNCAVCHGLQGRGDGPYAPLIETPPADLTVLAKNNGGIFPLARVYEAIDGEREFLAHGPRDMPVWGWEYRADLLERYGDAAFEEAGDLYVRARILALAEYISRLQQK